MLKKYLRFALAFLVSALCAGAGAQDFPNRPVRIVVPFEAGAPDAIARIVAQQLTAQTGQTFVVENRPGANGMIGADAVAKAKPDGYTVLVTSTSITVNPSIYRKLPYDLAKDLVPVTNLGAVEALLVVVNPSVPAQNLQEFLAFAKKKDSRVSYGSPGTGNQLHVASELFNVRAGLGMVHIPYKGAGPAATALLSGQIQLLVTTPPLVLAHIRAGKLRALAYTHNKRASYLPDVPTMNEAGFPGFEVDGGWFGMFAPAGTPREIVARLQAEVKTAFKNPQVRERIVALGMEPVGDSPADFKAYVDAEVRKYAERVRLTGIQPE